MTVLIFLAILLAIAGAAYKLAPQGWRTYAFHIATLVIAGVPEALDYFHTLTADVWQQVGLDARQAMLVVLGVNVAGLFFRKVTTTPAGSRD
ncbi:MAG TPA: hypothetical protein VFB16_14665 [Bauldia sp.]|nr:hypothetical protein [Bauldia sp.]